MRPLARNLIVAISLAPLALAGCNLASRFIPPIEISSAFGIGTPDHPTTITAPAFQDPGSLGPLLPAASGAIDYKATDLTFDDLELPNMYGFTIDGLWVTIGLGDVITLERENGAAAYPVSFTLTGFEAHIRIGDVSGARKPVNYHFKEKSLNIRYARQGTCDSGSTCSYRSDTPRRELEQAMLFSIPERDGSIVRDLIAVISGGGTNTARVKVRLSAGTPDGELEGLVPTFQISNPSTKISLGG